MRRIYLICLLVLFELLYSQVLPTYENVDYIGDGNIKHFLDIYIPTNIVEPSPLMIWIHGGAWFTGSKGDGYYFCDTLYHNGYVIADINYRLSGDSIFPAQIYDCKAAIKFLKAHAEDYMIDTSRIAVGGTSAGAHLACLVGSSGNCDCLENDDYGNNAYSSNVHAVCDFYGAIDFIRLNDNIPLMPPDSCESYIDHETDTSWTTMLLDCPVYSCPEDAECACPLTYLDSDDPSFIIFHGTYDCVFSPYQSLLLDSALSANGIAHDLFLIPGAGHGRGGFDWETQKHRMRLFLDELFFTEDSTRIHFNILPEFSFYPNPFNENITIKSNVNFEKVTIFDTRSSIVYSKSFNPSETMAVWEPSEKIVTGIYLIKISCHGKTFSKHVTYIAE